MGFYLVNNIYYIKKIFLIIIKYIFIYIYKIYILLNFNNYFYRVDNVDKSLLNIYINVIMYINV